MKAQNLTFSEKPNVMVKGYDKAEIANKKKRSMSPVSKHSSKYPKSSNTVISMSKVKTRVGPRKKNLKTEAFGIY